MFQLGDQIVFDQNGKQVQGMVLRTISWEDDEIFYLVQLPNGDRVSIPVNEQTKPAGDDNVCYPGSDCQV